MTPSNDYSGEMRENALTDREIEDVLSGRPTGRSDLDALAARIASLSVDFLSVTSEQRASRFAAEAAETARESTPQPVVSEKPKRFAMAPRLAASLAAAALVFGITGVAYAADGSAPGDFLYGLDRAAERVGLNDGGLPERLEEAQQLHANGKTGEALNHAAEAIGAKSESAAQALLDVAAKLTESEAGSETAQAVHAQIAAMFEWMATTEASGAEFGAGVSEFATGFGNRPDNPGPDNGNPGNNNSSNGNGQGPPSTPPGKPGS